MPELQGRYNTLSFTPTKTDVVGISLFKETIGGTVQTTIYQRYRAVPPHHGGRVFARSVDPGEEHHDETVRAWIDSAEDVRDFRPASTRTADSAALLLSGAVGAIHAQTPEAGTTAAWIAEALDSVLTGAERDVLRSVLSTVPAGSEPPPIDTGSQWTDRESPTDGADFRVSNIYVDEDGVPQVQIRENGGETRSVTAEDIQRRAAAGEIRRVD